MRFNPIAFGIRLRELRMAANLTQEELAAQIGVDKQHISRMERGIKACSIDLLVVLSGTLEVSIDYLVLGERFYGNAKKDQLLTIIDQLSAVVKTL